MTLKATKFTPEVLLSAPRRGPAIPNPAGTHLLYTVSTYSFDNHTKTAEIRVYNIAARHSTLLVQDLGASDPVWLGDENQVLWLQSGDDGKTKLMVGDGEGGLFEPYAIYTFQGPVSSLKLKHLGYGKAAIAVAGRVSPSGELYNPEKSDKPLSSGKLYQSLFVRHWDTYRTPYANTIWYGFLEPATSGSGSGSSRKIHSVASSGLTNALKGTHLESPIPPFGGTDNFDIGASGILLVAKDPRLNPATTTKSDPYFIPFESQEPSLAPRLISTKNLQGASSCPVFSPDGKSAAFLRMKDIAYESDRNRVIIVPDILHDPKSVPTSYELEHTEDNSGTADISPGSITWSNDGDALFLMAEATGKTSLYMIQWRRETSIRPPQPVYMASSLSAVYPLGVKSKHLILSSSTLVDNSLWTVVDPFVKNSHWTLSSNSKDGRRFGLHPQQVSDIWFSGSHRSVHAWVVKPSNFDSRNSYPLAYMIHGGPQGAWLDGWSTRWNPAVFAEQGYVVVCPNLTGSTGYGQEFVDAIQDQWGGLPYQDLEKGFEYIKKHMPYVNIDRAVALGASYGGYMMNWIQGQPLGRKLKALVTHDGVYSTLNQYSTEELYFPNHDFKGTPWRNRASYERWDPARFIDNWATPHLIIHNELDYRLPISEGLAAFNVLQSRGVESQFLTFPDENHWVLKPENSLVWHAVVLNWINKFCDLPPYKTEKEVKVLLLAKEMAKTKLDTPSDGES